MPCYLTILGKLAFSVDDSKLWNSFLASVLSGTQVPFTYRYHSWCEIFFTFFKHGTKNDLKKTEQKLSNKAKNCIEDNKYRKDKDDHAWTERHKSWD